MNKLSVKDIDVRGRRVFVRVDFNVPIKDGKIKDKTRITAALPTIRHLLDGGAAVILASHLGRPKGGPSPEFSLEPVAAELAGLLGRKVGFATDCVGEPARSAVQALQPGDVLLLENLRFHKEEEQNNPGFAEQLAGLADVYVNDAFGTAHRAHASTEGMTRFFKERAAGLLMERELYYLGKALSEPERPFVAILGGAKVSDKIEVITNLMGKVDALLIGGAMAYTFLKARGESVGQSLVEPDKIELAARLLLQAAERGLEFLLPVDHVIADRIAEDARVNTTDPGDPIPDGWMGVDIGPMTYMAYARKIQQARTMLWNGPMGVFEIRPFANGTQSIAKAVAASSACSIIGGGDSVSAVQQAGVADAITHISTGGGASLEFLGGLALPGVTALSDR
ncbi:MAG: phosphoglycerate kinase [Acidobacteria bacterium]|nr:phosphoglycerate kinase [Acidobacteriota bacterium]